MTGKMALLSFFEKQAGRKVPLFLCALVLAGLSLRCWRIAATSLWMDEALSVLYARNLNYYFSILARYLYEPPGYPAILWPWIRVFGDSIFSVRLFSVIPSVASIVMTYGVGKLLCGRKVGLSAALLTAFSPFHVWYAQEARGYSWASLAALAVVYAGLRIRTAPRFPLFLVLLFFVLFGISLDYFVAFPVVSILFFLYFCLRKERAGIQPRSGKMYLAILSFCAFLFIVWIGRLALMQLFSLRESFWLPRPRLGSLGMLLANFLLGYNATDSAFRLAIVLSAVLCGIWAQESWKTREGRLLLSLTILPPLAIFLLTQFFCVFLTRKFLIFSPFVYIALARGAVRLRNRWVLIVAWAALCVLMFFSLANYYARKTPSSIFFRLGVSSKRSLDPLMGMIAARREPGDMVVHDSFNTIQPFLYYFRDQPIAQAYLMRGDRLHDFIRRKYYPDAGRERDYTKPFPLVYYYIDALTPAISTLRGRRIWVVRSDGCPLMESAFSDVLRWEQTWEHVAEKDGVSLDLIIPPAGSAGFQSGDT